MAHWRTMVGTRQWFDVADLGGRDLLVQIESCKPGAVIGVIAGKRQETRAVMVRFVGFDRPLAVKATLAKSLVSLYGTGDIEQWVGRWVWLTAAMVSDPSGGRGALCEAVRIRPGSPTDHEIAEVVRARPRTISDVPAAVPALALSVCAAMDAATTAEGVEQAIAPHRDALRQLDERARTIVASAKRARLATLAEGAAQ